MEGSASGVNIGNYKGVMLCNRPFNGVAVPAKTTTTSPSKSPFYTGVAKGTLGQNVPILSEPLHAVKRDKSNTALSKHKKWLHDLKMEREKLQKALLSEEERKAAQKRRFAEREAKMRADIRRAADPETNDEVADPKSSKNKPMWALTKEVADEEVERKEEEDADDLIDFANNLDIDAFMDDVERKAVLEQMDKRMQMLQAEVDGEEAAEKRAEILAVIAEEKAMALNADNLSKLDDDDKKNADDDVASVATTVLSECKSIRSVHSAKSMAILTKRAMSKLEAVPEAQDKSVAPKIVVHEDNRLSSKELDPSNLPYMHRNPAI